MSAVLLGRHEPNSPEWHALRTTGIGASEIAAVVGLSPWSSPLSLWHRKKGDLPEQEEAAPMTWGNILEPVVADHFAGLHPEFDVHPVGTYAHSERRWQMANLDRALTSQVDGELVAVLEIKTTKYPDGWGPSGSTEIPPHVRCQVLQQMDVMGVQWAWVAVLISGSDYREFLIEYDEADAAFLRERGAAFWQSLEDNDRPPIDAHSATYEAVRQLHPDIDRGLEVELPVEMFIAYDHHRTVAEAALAESKRTKAQVLDAMGDARFGTVNGARVVRRQATRNGAIALYPVTQEATA